MSSSGGRLLIPMSFVPQFKMCGHFWFSSFDPSWFSRSLPSGHFGFHSSIPRWFLRSASCVSVLLVDSEKLVRFRLSKSAFISAIFLVVHPLFGACSPSHLSSRRPHRTRWSRHCGRFPKSSSIIPLLLLSSVAKRRFSSFTK